MDKGIDGTACESLPSETQELVQVRLPRVRARSESVARYSKSRLRWDAEEYPEDTSKLRPKTRSECAGGARPCPFVSCSHHLFLDVSEENGNIKFNFPHLEVWEMKHSCALDAAESGELFLADIGERMNLTQERVRMIEAKALTALRNRADAKVKSFLTEKDHA